MFFCTKKTWSPIKTVGVFESIKMTSQLVNWRGCFSWRGMHKVEPLEPTPEVRCWIVTLETQDLSCSHQGGRICRLVFSDAKGIFVLYLQIAKYLVWCEKFPGIFEVQMIGPTSGNLTWFHTGTSYKSADLYFFSDDNCAPENNGGCSIAMFIFRGVNAFFLGGVMFREGHITNHGCCLNFGASWGQCLSH